MNKIGNINVIITSDYCKYDTYLCYNNKNGCLEFPVWYLLLVMNYCL